MDLQLSGIFISLLLSAWFAGAETTFLCFNKARLQAWLLSGVQGSHSVDFMNRHPERFLVTTLASNNLVNVLYSSLIALWLTKQGFSGRFILIVAPLLLLVFGEAIPKVIARSVADRIILVVGIILYWLRMTLLPMFKLIEFALEIMQRWLSLPEQAMGQVLSRADITMELKKAEHGGIFSDETAKMLHRFIGVSERCVKDIMTPRTAIVAVSIDESVAEAQQQIIESGFSRLPCYDKTIDNVAGLLTTIDLLTNPASIQSAIRPLSMVPVSLPVVNLTAWMKKYHTTFAGVLDEYGGLAGIVTIDDVAQELVGLIRDEFDIKDSDCIRLSDRSWLIIGRTRMSLLTERIGFEPFTTKASSLGGAIINYTGSIPKVGDEFNFPKVKLRIIRADKKGIGLVGITVKENVIIERES
ncbi:MAG: hemolysin family protein [Candidatus Hatepunaea meridiana]|nr:hemolysin family protein [Candidatus Hatepunaea meridiana]